MPHSAPKIGVRLGRRRKFISVLIGPTLRPVTEQRAKPERGDCVSAGGERQRYLSSQALAREVVPHLVGGDCVQRSAQAEVRNMIVDADCRVTFEAEGAEAHQLSRNGETGTPTPLPRLRHSKEPRCFRFGFSGLGPGRCGHLEPLAMSPFLVIRNTSLAGQGLKLISRTFLEMQLR
jgi:hypothetical protein